MTNGRDNNTRPYLLTHHLVTRYLGSSENIGKGRFWHISIIVLAHSLLLTMRHFWKPHVVGLASNPPGGPSGEPAHGAGNSLTFSARTAPNTRLIRWIVILGIALVAVIIAATVLTLLSLRDRELAASEREQTSLTFVLAEQIDRSFQSMELTQTAVIEKMQDFGIASAEDYERQMSGQDTYQHLKDQINGLPYVDALVLFDTEGKRINVSRMWPNSVL